MALPDSRARLGLDAGEGEDAGPDDEADTEAHEVERAEATLQAGARLTVRSTRLLEDDVDRFGLED